MDFSTFYLSRSPIFPGSRPVSSRLRLEGDESSEEIPTNGPSNPVRSITPFLQLFLVCLGQLEAFQTTKHEEIMRTPWKINTEPENDGLEDDFPFQLGGF